ncbi:MAG: CoA pyrophosphatase [Chloroflexota bacterium]
MCNKHNKRAPTLDNLLTTFPKKAPVDILLPAGILAAVSIIFWVAKGDLRICIGQRAVRADDPWSGDMAFPGGKAESSDETIHDVAARETYEEVGLHLPPERLIGRLDPVMGGSGGSRPPLAVQPLVYLLSRPPSPFKFDNELDAAYWVSVDHLWDPTNWSTIEYARTGQHYPAIKIADHYLWGFTLGVMVKLSHQLGHPLMILS